jgi:3-hydroxyisobutyrate dehydrogenase-like beta-hydroxyacid dehydrogenase
MKTKERVGIVGLGLIGSAWARHLEADGVLAAAWNRSRKISMPRVVTQLKEVAERSTIIHVVVSDEHALLETLSALAPHLGSQHLVVQSTTINPQSSAQACAVIEERGACYVEAPFTGSLPAAEKRETVFFIGISGESSSRAQSYLQRLSKKQFLVGDSKTACTLKLVMNLQIASAMSALGEALTISRSQGISDQLFFEIFRANASYSGVAALKEPRLMEGDFTPQFSVKHMRKDMRLLGEFLGMVESPVLATVTSLLSRAEERGLGDEDFSAMIKIMQVSQ